MPTQLRLALLMGGGSSEREVSLKSGQAVLANLDPARYQTVVFDPSYDLARLVDQGRLREDLYYRLAVFPIALPPLRERGQDLGLLLDHFVERLSREVGRTLAFTPAAREALLRYAWPGNLREMANLVERLGDVPLDRLRIPPAPGTATEKDLIAALEGPQKHICELVDGVLVEKPFIGVRFGEVRLADIPRACDLLLLASIAALPTGSSWANRTGSPAASCRSTMRSTPRRRRPTSATRASPGCCRAMAASTWIPPRRRTSTPGSAR